MVKAGAYKDVGNFARAMTPEERRILQSLLDDVYDQFISAVAEGRGLDPQAVRAFAEGRIYSGRQAHGLKMVDDLGGLEDAIEAAAKMAGLPPQAQGALPAAPVLAARAAAQRVGSAGRSRACCRRCRPSAPRST